MKNISHVVRTKGSARILVLEPNDTLRTLYGRVLRKCSYAIHTASTYEEAVGCLPTFEPNLLLVSFALPGNGVEQICERIRSCASLSKVQIICTTPGDITPAITRARAAGIDHLLQLPFDFAELQSLIAQFTLECVGNNSYPESNEYELGIVHSYRFSSTGLSN